MALILSEFLDIPRNRSIIKHYIVSQYYVKGKVFFKLSNKKYKTKFGVEIYADSFFWKNETFFIPIFLKKIISIKHL